jgi:DNA-binding Lrp family transcriptional regulator
MRKKEEKIRSIVLISTNPAASSSNITQRIREIEGVESVHEVTGQYDIATLLSRNDIKSLNTGIDDIRRIDGILNTNTLIILKSSP